MIEFQVLISFSVAVFFLAISPGPDNIFVAFQSLRFGFKSGLFVIMGLMSGCLVHTILGAFGAAVFLARFPFLLIVIKILGALYLLYLAYSLYKQGAPKTLSAIEVVYKKSTDLYKQGFVMSVLNPKVGLFFIAFFPGFLFIPSAPFWIQFLALGGVFIMISTFVFSSIALGSSILLNTATKSQATFFKVLHWLQIILFLGIAIFLFLP